LGVVFLALGTICVGALCAITLWVLFGSPLEPRRSNADAPGLSSEARKGESLERIGPLRAGDPSRQGLARDAGAQGRPGSSSADAAEQKAAKETQIEARAGADQAQLLRTEPQDRRPAAGQESSRTLTDSPPRMQCNVDLCTARYASFHAADCTYQPHGGGSRQICELSTRSADARPQTSRAAADPRSEAKDTRVAERAAEVAKSTTPARAGAQCNVDHCAATYASF